MYRKKSHIWHITTASAIALLIGGCSSIPDQSEGPNLTEISKDRVSDWEYVPAITHKSYRNNLDLLEPGSIPTALYDIPMDVDLDNDLSVRNLIPFFEREGVSVAIADNDIADQLITIPKYSGNLGGFLAILSNVTDLSFRWEGQTLIVDKQGDYIVSVPQNEDLLEGVESALDSIGASEISVSLEAGLISYSATQSRQRFVEAYLDQLSANTALINLQVAVVNVSLNRSQSSGLNWSSLSAKVGDLGLIGAGNESSSNGGSNGESPGSSAAGGFAGTLTGSSFDFAAEGADISLDGVLSLLSTYGDTRTTQNLTLKTLSGISVNLRSGQTIPYIDNLETSSRSGEDATISGTDVEELETGFEVEISPYYDSSSQIVTINLDVSLKSLIGFRELVAESSTGALRQPETRDQELTSIVRLEAGETALIGGLVYESVSDNRSSLRGLEDAKIAGKNTETTNNALFILTRPTVTVYGPDHRSEEEGR